MVGGATYCRTGSKQSRALVDTEQEIRNRARETSVRNIDDLSEFSVNQAYATPEKLDLGGVDEVVAMAAAWARIASKAGCKEGVELRGRCLDLKSACVQTDSPAQCAQGSCHPISVRPKLATSEILQQLGTSIRRHTGGDVFQPCGEGTEKHHAKDAIPTRV